MKKHQASLSWHATQRKRRARAHRALHTPQQHSQLRLHDAVRLMRAHRGSGISAECQSLSPRQSSPFLQCCGQLLSNAGVQLVLIGVQQTRIPGKFPTWTTSTENATVYQHTTTSWAARALAAEISSTLAFPHRRQQRMGLKAKLTTSAESEQASPAHLAKQRKRHRRKQRQPAARKASGDQKNQQAVVGLNDVRRSSMSR